ncbi:response regulator [Brucepastera parasyntrophica]|uniref:ATP-binding protein n=1 Tax=Brucepastera parasyntrophica TaxID=2880008 RepID=UPI00210CB339|nr:ATP-binding protein [Brucepastera parasyntrophica]ULQ60114.1 response regulator [Brucepastera parasyntrophica]
MKKFFQNNSILLLFFVSAAVVLIISLYSRSLMNSATSMLEYNTEQRLLVLSKAAANLVSVEELEQFKEPEDMQKPLYSEIRRRLADFVEDSDILFAYYLRPKNGMLQFVVDNDFDQDSQVGLDSELVDFEPAPTQAFNGIATSSGLGNYSQNWDGILAAYAPVYDTDGNIYCIAGVDMSDEQIVFVKNNMELLTIVQIISLAIVIISGFWGLKLFHKKAVLAESASRAKSGFLSRMSHEIRTPLNAIIGFSRMAGETGDTEKTKEYLDNINTASGHLLNLINDILDISKIESGKMFLDESYTNTQNEIDTISSMIIPQVEAKKQNFTLSVSENLPQYVYCDSTHIKQIIINLLSNAVKFTPEGGNISLHIKAAEIKNGFCTMEWRVKDNGIGIEPEFLEKLFQPFEQGDGSTTRKYGGTGLGLAISKQLAEMMGGRLEVFSAPGSGSEFIVTMKLRTATADESQNDVFPTTNTDLDLNGKHILLIEDSELNQIIAENVLTGMGATVDFAGNGLNGLNMYFEHPEKFDMIFMDIQMPIMDGHETTRKIRASELPNATTIPIIAMTANVFKEDIQKAKDAGMNAHIGKPLDIAQVKRTIASVLFSV